MVRLTVSNNETFQILDEHTLQGMLRTPARNVFSPRHINTTIYSKKNQQNFAAKVLNKW